MKRIFLLNLCFILFVPFTENKKQILNDFREMKMTEFINVAMYVTKRFISPKTNTLIIMEKCDYVCEEHKKYHTTLLQEFLKNLNDTLAIQLFFAQPENRPWDYNLFIVDSWASFESLRIIIPTTKHERDFYFFILLTWSSDFMLMRNLNQIFRLCQRFLVSNVVVMAKSESASRKFIGFYSYQMFSLDNCFAEVTVREINRYENGKLKNDFLFPKKLNNYFGCTLTISARIYKPLLTFNGNVENKTHLRDMERLGGVEGEILKLVALALNFTIKLRFSKEKSVINLQLNSTGCFADLEHTTAHAAIGGLSSTIRNNQKFTKSFAHHTTSYKFVVRSNLLFGSITQLINPLHDTTWIYLILSLTTPIVLIQVLNILKHSKIQHFIFGIKNQDPTFNLILSFLGYSMPSRVLPKRNFARYILILWLLFGLIMRTSYQGKMFDSLRLGKRKPVPRTIKELIAMDYKFLSPTYTTFYPYNQTLIYKGVDSLLHQVQSSEKTLTAAVVSDALADYNFKNRNFSSLTSVEESIFSYQCVIYFRKNSMLRESFQRKLTVFRNSGISSHIAKKHVHLYFKDINSRSEHVSRITFSNLKGLYYIYGMFCFICIVIFLLELAAMKSRVLKYIIDLLN